MRFTAITLPTVRAFSLVLFGLAVADTARADIISKTFDIDAGGELVVDTDVGAIRIATHNASRIDVEVERSGKNAENLEVEFAQSGNTLQIDGRMEKSFNSWWGGDRSKVEFQITVPQNFNVDLKTRGGSIGVEDLSGEVKANTSGGSLRFGRIEGKIDAHTSGGSIRIEGGGADIDVRTSGGSISIGEASGNVEARTSGGSIRIKDASGSVNARTSGGSVEATLRVQPSGDSSLATSGGSVRLYVADNIGLDIDASSSSGVRSDFPIDGKTKDERRLRGPMNGGGPRMRLSTSGGSVKIYSADKD